MEDHGKDGEQILEIRAEERAKAEKEKSKKRGVEEDYDTNKRRKKRQRKLKFELVNVDWGLKGDEMEEMERQEIARTRFLHSDPKVAIIPAGCKRAENLPNGWKKQSKIRIGTMCIVIQNIII